jgi:hypothetical protein
MRVGPVIAKRLGASFYFVPAKPHTEKFPSAALCLYRRRQSSAFGMP